MLAWMHDLIDDSLWLLELKKNLSWQCFSLLNWSCLKDSTVFKTEEKKGAMLFSHWQFISIFKNVTSHPVLSV